MSTLDQEDVTALVNELIKQSQRLGLTWGLRRGTVVGAGNALVLDDDSDSTIKTTVPAISLIGDLPVGARVMTMNVPPSGLYILSWLNADTGTINDTDAGAALDITDATGWTLGSYSYRKIGNVLYLRVANTRSGATITADAGGNIADTAVFTLGPAFLPFTNVYSAFRSTSSGGSAQLSSASGVMSIVDMHSTSTITTSQGIISYWVFPLASP